MSKTGRRQCTKKNPYTELRDETEPGYGWEHDDILYLGDSEDGALEKYRCNNCGVVWKQEIPQ